MRATSQFANRFREVILNGTFIAFTNFKDQLSDLSWTDAVQKIGNLNSIAALTFHIHYYVHGVLHVLEGGSLDIKDKFSFDMPSITSQQEWDHLRESLFSDAEKFAKRVEALPEEKLLDFFVDEKYGTYDRNLNGMIEHCYYHLGQVVLIKKMVLTLSK